MKIKLHIGDELHICTLYGMTYTVALNDLRRYIKDDCIELPEIIPCATRGGNGQIVSMDYVRRDLVTGYWIS